MSKIYSEANNFRVWLGKEIPGKSEVALKFITRILDFENFNRLIADGRLVAEWASLLSLMKSSWFGRRWVLQEVALARKAYIHCGKDWVPWDDFADAVRLFQERTPTIQQHLMNASELGFRSDLVQDIEAMSATRLVHATSDLFRKSNDGHILEWMRGLETLVSELSAFEATNPRDVIYGVLALARDTRSTANKRIIGREIAMPPNAHRNGHASLERPKAPVAITPPPSDRKRKAGRGSTSKVKRQRANGLDTTEVAGPSTRRGRTQTPAQTADRSPQAETLTFTTEEKRLVKLIMTKLKDRIAAKTFIVNYDKSLFHVCKDFLVFVTRKSKNLDILCRPWAPDSEDLPSWIPKLSAGSHVKRDDGTFLRINADPLVGGPDGGRKIYNASKSFQANFRFGDGFKRQNPKSLLVQGIVLDTIAKTTRLPAVSGDIPKEWPDFAGWKDISAYHPPNQFWLTLVAGRGPDGLNPPDYRRRACQYAFKKRGPGGPLDVRYMLADPAFNTIAKEFLKRMQSVVWMRLLMLTENKGVLGLVSQDAMPGDQICILFGCSVPVVLREERHGAGANAGTHFRFLGEVYIDGYMDGQALDTEEGQAKNYRMFELR